MTMSRCQSKPDIGHILRDWLAHPNWHNFNMAGSDIGITQSNHISGNNKPNLMI